MNKKYIQDLLVRRYVRPRFNFIQLQLFSLSIFVAGAVVGLYFLTNQFLIPRLFASTSWTQTDWSGGVGASTATQYSSASNVDSTSVGQLSLATKASWYNTAWSYRSKITIDNTTANVGTTSETLTNFPMLVKLDSTRLSYANTQDAGQDIRFADSDGTTLLSYEIEQWNESGTSYVWVEVPEIASNSNTDYIYVYYGNAAASDAQSASGVWSNGYHGVYHLDETSGIVVAGSTSTPYNGAKSAATEPAPTASGQIGGAQDFDGSNDYIRLTDLPSPGTPVTLEMWINPDSSTPIGIFDSAPSTAHVIRNYNSGNIEWFGESQFSLAATGGQWMHIVLVFEYDGNRRVTYYKNGVKIDTYVGSTTATLAWDHFRLGDVNNGSNGNYAGLLDEFRASTTPRTYGWSAATYKSETDDFITVAAAESTYETSGTLTSNIFDSDLVQAWGTATYTAGGTGTTTVKVRTSNSSSMVGATAFSSCDAVTSTADISSNNCVTDGHRYIQYQVGFSGSGFTTPTFSDIAFAFGPYDTTAPPTNASSVTMTGATNGNWTAAEPTISWTAGADQEGGSGLLGYCIALDEVNAGNASSALDPATTAGTLLNALDDGVESSACEFIVTSTSVNLSTISGLTLTSGKQYYFSIKAIDNAANLWTGSAGSFQDLISFKYDTVVPTNVTYLSVPATVYSSVDDMEFSWPITGANAAADTQSGVLGWQYQIGGTDSDGWKGTTTHATFAFDYIPSGDSLSSHSLTTAEDGADISEGVNTVYFRTVDAAGNFSSTATIRTAPLEYGGGAPTFATACSLSTGVTVTPSTNTSNSFALSWDAATAQAEKTIDSYYYMINTTAPTTLSTLTSNSTQYIPTDSTSVATGLLVGAVRGSNTVYVVAVDSSDSYSSSNCIKGVFTLDSSLPDAAQNLTAADASVKAGEIWRVALSWGVPAYTGTGDLTYQIQRSTDNSTWSTVSTTTGTSYTDTVATSRLYYYRVGTYDSTDDSEAAPSYTSSVSETPTGSYTEAAGLSSGPDVSSITTRRATITWATSRTSDSKVTFGTASGDYYDDEPSRSDQVTSHEIKLNNLSPGTKYYFRVKWTDEDGNTGESDEKTFTTQPAPTVTDPHISRLGIADATLEYTVKGAVKNKIYYGITTSFGAVKEVSTSTSETKYTVVLADLLDGTKYYYKINSYDSENTEYEGNILSFQTLPRPRVTSIRLQEVKGTAQPTMLVTWESNTELSSIVSYYPVGQPTAAQDLIKTALRTGTHQMVVKGLLPQQQYALIVRGRDAFGNEATSDVQTFTTSTDTRAPQISNLKIEGSTIPKTASAGQETTAQLVISWTTDEQATSQVEFGEGTGNSYSQKSQEDNNLTFNHLVIVSNLTPSKVYHLRALSEDSVGNSIASIDTVTITPKATDNALNLVISNLLQTFGFLSRQ